MNTFSVDAEKYAKYRPVYPKQLFSFLASLITKRNVAWDCGTGNGQSAADLADLFEKVIATDISEKQLVNAVKKPNIIYKCEPAESTSIREKSIDLITVSQALHWFNFNEFYSEVKRVGAPSSILAVWTYSLLQIDSYTDDWIRKYHFNTLKDHWDPERKHVDNGYSDIPFPFLKMRTPEFSLQFTWSLDDLAGYLNTWSGTKNFIARHNFNPVDTLIKNISNKWASGELKAVTFPIHLKVGMVH